MSAALALAQAAITTAPTRDHRPALNLVHVAEKPAAQLTAERLRKRVGVRSRLAAMVEGASELALFHAYRP